MIVSMNRVRGGRLWLAILALGLSAGGCSIWTGQFDHTLRTDVRLDRANFKVVRTVSGQAKANYVFGIGPSKQDLYGQARRELVEHAELQGPQALVNFTTDLKRSGFIFWGRNEVYVSADVIEFTD